MRLLKIVTAAMGVLIVLGTVSLAFLIARRMAGPVRSATVLLPQPAGSRITAMAATANALAITVQGGGPDRILLLDPRTLQPVGQLRLTAPLDAGPKLP